MKTVLITGGSKGIGKAISLKMAREKYNVIINYFFDETKAQETLNECREVNENVILIKCDVSNYEAVKGMFNEILKTFNSIDIIINNAGLNIDKPVIEMSEEDWERVVDVNMKGPFLVSKIAATIILSQGGKGNIINIGSTTGISGRKNGINYCASKAGLIVMTKCLAKELAPNIRVNCVIPGITRTEEIEKRFDLKINEKNEVLKRAIPLNRIGETYEIADVISFLISDKAEYINGQKIIVDGGEYMF
jgi:NAD(P)-dependent dehydrogenase (short-subunit alcohol dehydrogenase family)